MGIEPTSQPWEGRILPMNYTRVEYRCIIADGTSIFNCFLSLAFCKKRPAAVAAGHLLTP